MTTVTVLYADIDGVRKKRTPFTPWQPGDPMENMGRVEVEPPVINGKPNVYSIADLAYFRCQNIDEHRNTLVALGTDARSMAIGDVVVIETDSIALACEPLGFRELNPAEYNDIGQYL